MAKAKPVYFITLGWVWDAELCIVKCANMRVARTLEGFHKNSPYAEEPDMVHAYPFKTLQEVLEHFDVESFADVGDVTEVDRITAWDATAPTLSDPFQCMDIEDCVAKPAESPWFIMANSTRKKVAA
jgi:hypothetical protein